MSADELEKLFPNRPPITVGGKTLTLSPVPIGKLAELARLALPGSEGQPGMTLPNGMPVVVWLATEPLGPWIQAVALLTRESEDWVSSLPGDEFVALLERVIEVNARFFADVLAPALGRLTAMLTPTAGPTPSPDSVPTGTDYPT